MKQRAKLHLLASTTAGILAPLSALADVTAADVWANIQAGNAAIGATVTADVTESDGTLTAENMILTFALPMGVGSATINYGTITLTEQGDGTVALGGPESQTLSMGLSIPPGTVDVTMGYTVTDYTTIASGEPGDVSYEYSVGSAAITFEDLSATGEIAEEMGDFELTGNMTLSGMSGTYRMTEGDVFTITTDGDIENMDFDFAYVVGDGEDTIRSENVMSMGATTGATTLTVPSAGVSLMALPAALRAGLSLDGSYTSASQDSEQNTYLNDELFMSQIANVGEMVSDIAFGEDGLSLATTASDYALEFTQPMVFPFPVKADMESASGEVTVPLLANDEDADAVVRLALGNLTMDPELWAMFDPGAQLPRDPANVTLDVTSNIKLLIDLLDFPAMAQLEQTGELPLELNSVNIDALNIQAVGAAADAFGAFTFDMTDLETFGGMPAPDGNATVTLSGVDTLLAKLQEMGFVQEEDLMGVRMVLGGFFRPGSSAEEYVTEIEVDGETGAVSANGMRLK